MTTEATDEPKEDWIERARRGSTKAHRVQVYLDDDDYEWFQQFREERGLSESKAAKLCIRHVRIEHGMQRRGREQALAQHEIDIETMVAMRGSAHGESRNDET